LSTATAAPTGTGSSFGSSSRLCTTWLLGRPKALLDQSLLLRLLAKTGGWAMPGENLTQVNPHFDANHAKGRMGLGQTIINIRTQRLQRNFPLYFFLRTRNLGSAESSTDNNFNALCAGVFHRLLHRLFHRTAERDALLQLFCDAATDENRIQLWIANLHNIHAHASLLRLRLESCTQPIDLFTALPNHNARSSRKDLHQHLISRRALNFDTRDTGIRQLTVHNLAD
jgi:hypothetical protein